MQGREIIFEYRPRGNLMQICAIDVATTTEISVFTPINAPKQAQNQLALNKLHMVLKKNGHIR